MEAWVANPTATNYKSIYDKYETFVSREVEGVYITQALNDMVNYWRQKAIEPKEHESYFINIALPKIATRMARTRYLNEQLTNSVYLFLRKTADIATELMPQNNLLYAEFLVHAFDHSSSFYSSKTMPQHLMITFPNATIPVNPVQQLVIVDEAPAPAEPASGPNQQPSFDEEPCDQNPYATFNTQALHYPSQYMPDFINWFGSIGGFKAVFAQFALDTTPPIIIATLINAVKNACSHGFILPRRLAQFTPKIAEMATVTKGLSAAQLKNAKKEDLETLIRQLGHFLKLTMSNDAVADCVDQLGLRFAAQCLSSGVLTLRLFALAFLGSAIDTVQPRVAGTPSSPNNKPGTTLPAPEASAPPLEHRWLNIFNLIEWIRGSQILSHIFGDSSHSQLIKNSGKLMRFLAQFGGLSVPDIELLWKCCGNSHESLANDALNVLLEIAGYLTPPLADPIIRALDAHVRSAIETIRALDPVSLEEVSLPLSYRDLNNIASLAHRFADDSQRLHLINLLISVIEFSPVYLVNDTIALLVEIFKSERFRPHRLATVNSFLDILQDDDHPNKSFYCSLIDPIVATWTQEDPTTRDSLVAINQKLGCPLEEFLAEELLRFKDQCRHFVTDDTYNDTDGIRLAGSTTYIKELQNRLYLLYHLFTQGQGHLTRETMLKLWDCLYNDALNFGEAEECAKWFEAAAADGCITPTLADQLFQNRFLRLDFRHLTPGLYVCWERYFIQSNVVLQQISLIPPKPGQQAPPTPDFEVSTYPDKLIGESCLWDIALTNYDSSVVQSALKMLIKCMEQLDATVQLLSGPVDLRQHFISKCLSRLPEWSAQYKSLLAAELTASDASITADLEHLEKLITNSLTLLVQLMDTVEPAASKRSTITRGMPISVRVHAALEVPSSINPSNLVELDFNVDCDLSTVFSSLQALVASRLEPVLKQHSIAPEELIYIQTYPWYRRLDHDQSIIDCNLGTLQLYDRDLLQVIRLPSVVGRETVLRSRKGNSFKNEDKVRPADADKRIAQICEFADWSTDLAEFALKSNGWDVEQVGNVVMDESKRTKLLNEAKKAGVGRQSTPNNDSAPGKDILEIMKQRTEAVLSLTDDSQTPDAALPSAILSSTKSHFDALFGLFTLGNDAVSNSVWSIILRIPTSLSIKSSLLSRDVPDWSELLPLDVYRLSYTVQIIDQILCPLDDSWQLARRFEWARWFQATGGVTQLFKVVSTFETEELDLVQAADGQESSELPLPAQTRRDCLITTLKILDFFLSTYAESLNVARIEEVPKELSPADIENEDAIAKPQQPKLAPQHSSLHSAYTADLKETMPILLPVDCDKAIQHLQVVLAWAQKTKPQVANGPLVGYAWRCFVNMSLTYRERQHATISAKSPRESTTARGAHQAPQPTLLTSHCLSVVLDLLTDLTSDVRRETATNMLNLAILDEKSGASLLKTLLNSLPPDSLVESADLNLSSCYDWFYWLLEWVVKLRLRKLERDSPGSLFGDAVTQQFGELVESLQKSIALRPCTETGTHSYVDHMLNGSIRVLSAILKAWPTEYTAPEFLSQLFHFYMFTGKQNGNHAPKCQTNSSRASTYELLLTLARLSNENKVQLLSMLGGNHAAPYARMQSWDFHPGNEDKSSAGYVGLANLGATCYMNSLLQQFYMMPTLRRELLAAPVVLGPEDQLKEHMVYQFQQLMGNLQESEKASITPKDFIAAYRDFEGNPADVNMQQDVSEFFNLVCGTMENLLKGTADERLLQRNFGCVQVSQIKSMEPEYPFSSEREEDLYAIPLDVRVKNNFHDAMDLFVKQDLLEGDNKYKSDEYKRHIVATKGNLIKTMSNTLIFHLMRFDYDVATYRKRKLNEYFNFPMRINMKKWTKAGQAQIAQEQAGLPPNSELAAEFPEEYYDYQLAGILVHTGSADSGHYYSFIRERDSNGKWFQFNDRFVSEFDSNNIPNECFGGYHRVKEWDQHLHKEAWHDVPTERSAYMLFYERVNPIPPKPIAAPAQSTEPLSGNRKVIKPAAYVNGVPSEVHNRIWDDNASFLKIRQIFDHSYFEFMRGFAFLWDMEPVLHVSPEMEEELYTDTSVIIPGTTTPQHVELAAIKTLTRLAFEVVAHAKDNLVLTTLLDQLVQLLGNHVPACIWFVEYVRRHNLIKELFLACHIERSRIAFLDFFSQLLQALCRNEVVYCPRILVKGSNGVMSPVIGPTLPAPAEQTLISCVLDLMEESRGAWRRFKQYFGLTLEFARLSLNHRAFLVKRGLIADYVDYFMGQSHGGVLRARVMDEDNFPDLVEFIETVTVLTCSCKTENPSHMTPEDVAAGPNILAGPPRSRLQLGDLEMPAASAQDMYYATDFFTSLLEMDYNSPSTGDMLEYICWYSPNRTDYVLDHLLTKIDVKPSENKAPVLEYLLYRVLSIDDDLKMHRIERVMGKKETVSTLGKYSMGTKTVKSLPLTASSQPTHALLYMVGFMRLMESLPACYEYIAGRPVDVLGLRKFWRRQFEVQFPNISCEPTIMADAQAGLHNYFAASAELIHARHPSHPPTANSTRKLDDNFMALPPWRRSVPYLGLVYCAALAQSSGNSEAVYEDIVLDQERDIVSLRAKLATLEKEKKTLVKALVYVHDTYPAAKLEPKLQLKVEDIIREDLFSVPSSSRITNSGRPVTSISYLNAATNGAASAAHGAGVGSTNSSASATLAPTAASGPAPNSPKGSSPGSPSTNPNNGQPAFTEIFRTGAEGDSENRAPRNSPSKEALAGQPKAENGQDGGDREMIQMTGATVTVNGVSAAATAAAAAALGSDPIKHTGLTSSDDTDRPPDLMTTPQSMSGEYDAESFASLTRPTPWVGRDGPYGIDDDYETPIYPSAWKVSAIHSINQPPADWEDRVANLKGIGMVDNDEVLKLLLEENNWMVESAANELFDPETINRLNRKAALRANAESQNLAGSDQERDDGEVIVHH